MQGLPSRSPPLRPMVGRPANHPGRPEAGSSCRGLVLVFVIWPLPGLLERRRPKPARYAVVKLSSAALSGGPCFTRSYGSRITEFCARWLGQEILRTANSGRPHAVGRHGKATPNLYLASFPASRPPGRPVFVIPERERADET